MTNNAVPGLDVEVINEVERGKIKHALFDFDGTVSLLREGWQGIMAPVMIEMICGKTQPTPEIIADVHRVIDETTGIQTIFQMQRLQEMVREHGLVPEDEILDPYGYKDIYNDRLMVPVNERIARLEAGSLSVEEATVRGSLEFLKILHDRKVTLYVFSGTDQDDVRNEAAKVGAAKYFDEIWGALRSVEEYSKEKVLKELMAKHDLHGAEVLVVGDGPVEIRNGKESGCITIGVCSDEQRGTGWCDEKRARLTKAGADLLVPDFAQAQALVTYLFG